MSFIAFGSFHPFGFDPSGSKCTTRNLQQRFDGHGNTVPNVRIALHCLATEIHRRFDFSSPERANQVKMCEHGRADGIDIVRREAHLGPSHAHGAQRSCQCRKEAIYVLHSARSSLRRKVGGDKAEIITFKNTISRLLS